MLHSEHFKTAAPLGTLQNWYSTRNTSKLILHSEHFKTDAPLGTLQNWCSTRNTSKLILHSGHFKTDAPLGILQNWCSTRDTHSVCCWLANNVWIFRTRTSSTIYRAIQKWRKDGPMGTTTFDCSWICMEILGSIGTISPLQRLQCANSFFMFSKNTKRARHSKNMRPTMVHYQTFRVITWQITRHRESTPYLPNGMHLSSL